MKTKKIEKYSIYIQAALALLIIGVLHKFVRELPANIGYAEVLGNIAPLIFLWILVIVWITALTLTLLKLRIGLILGIICGIERIVGPILFHGISGLPANPVYYPIFCIVQGSLTIWFCFLAYKNFDFKE